MVAVLRLAFGALTLTALAVNLANGLDLPTFRVANYFSYFTNLSNLLAAIVLIVGATARPRSPRWDAIRGLAAFAMVVTGIIYAVLLAGEPLGVTDRWINTVIHRVMPLVMLADWLLLPPEHEVSPKVALAWLAYPLTYAAYTLIRGPLAGDFYPYPFIDPTRDGGLGRVLLNCVVLALLMAGLAQLVAWLPQRLRRPAAGR
jgi:hypothetical protein